MRDIPAAYILPNSAYAPLRASLIAVLADYCKAVELSNCNASEMVEAAKHQQAEEAAAVATAGAALASAAKVRAQRAALPPAGAAAHAKVLHKVQAVAPAASTFNTGSHAAQLPAQHIGSSGGQVRSRAVTSTLLARSVASSSSDEFEPTYGGGRSSATSATRGVLTTKRPGTVTASRFGSFSSSHVGGVPVLDGSALAGERVLGTKRCAVARLSDESDSSCADGNAGTAAAHTTPGGPVCTLPPSILTSTSQAAQTGTSSKSDGPTSAAAASAPRAHKRVSFAAGTASAASTTLKEVATLAASMTVQAEGVRSNHAARRPLDVRPAAASKPGEFDSDTSPSSGDSDQDMEGNSRPAASLARVLTGVSGVKNRSSSSLAPVAGSTAKGSASTAQHPASSSERQPPGRHPAAATGRGGYAADEDNTPILSRFGAPAHLRPVAVSAPSSLMASFAANGSGGTIPAMHRPAPARQAAVQLAFATSTASPGWNDVITDTSSAAASAVSVRTAGILASTSSAVASTKQRGAVPARLAAAGSESRADAAACAGGYGRGNMYAAPKPAGVGVASGRIAAEVMNGGARSGAGSSSSRPAVMAMATKYAAPYTAAGPTPAKPSVLASFKHHAGGAVAARPGSTAAVPTKRTASMAAAAPPACASNDDIGDSGMGLFDDWGMHA
jgi:hypothetical protein